MELYLFTVGTYTYMIGNEIKDTDSITLLESCIEVIPSCIDVCEVY